jgi:hypothetical protein
MGRAMIRSALNTLIVPLLLFSPSAGAQQTNELTLSCNGKSIDHDTEYPITNMSVVVNLTKMTVSGFVDFVANIIKVDDATIFFQGMAKEAGGEIETTIVVTGNIDRITGSTSVAIYSSGNEDIPSSTSQLQLMCTPH